MIFDWFSFIAKNELDSFGGNVGAVETIIKCKQCEIELNRKLIEFIFSNVLFTQK